jgi:dTDP-4-amino-4,6-dideoxygalactose transaminase
VDPRTHNLDPERVERMLTPRTTGIIGVHLWGRGCDTEALSEIADRRGLKLLYDAAHAFGCSRGGRMIGGFGDAEVFSFHATKFFNTFEGGAVTTNDDRLAERMRLMKNFGFAGYDRVVYIGTNGKMTEVSAAMGLGGLESLDEFIDTNRRNYRQYRHELEGLPGVTMLAYDEGERCNYQYVVLELDESVTRISRDALMDILWAENVLARRYFYPGCHRMEPYRSYFPHAGLLLPETERLAGRVLVLPTGTAVGAEDIEKLCRIIRTVVRDGASVSEMLGRGRAPEGGGA